MRIAVANENHQVYQHFGRCPSFMLFEVVDKKIVHKCELICGNVQHGAIVKLLKEAEVDVVIAGGMGLPMYNSLVESGMQVYGGVSGNVEEVIEDFLNGCLDYDPNAAQNHGGCHHQILS